MGRIRIRIQKPSENEADYVNRHFYHSINVQALCLPDGQFGDVLARFPGSVHDSRIWKLSQVGIYVENNFFVGEHILGDSGYMLQHCLLTPYRQPTIGAQNNYNYSQIACFDRTNLWKMEAAISLSPW